MKKLGEARRLPELCQTMARQLGLVERNGGFEVTSLGRRYLDSNGTSREDLLIRRMLQTYVRFRRLVRGLTRQDGNELKVPMGQERNSFLEVMNGAGFPDFSRIYFETVVDLATQLGLTNWHQRTAGPRTWVVYLTCSILFQRSARDIEGGLLVDLEEEIWRIDFNSVSIESFRDRLWKDYLSLTGYIARKPVLYSRLRSSVCYSLRISDRLFDELSREVMLGDPIYLLVGAGGTLSFQRDSASLIKSLPPKTDRGEYMVYLKMDKRS